MSKISTYEVAPVPKLSDKLIGTSVGGKIEDVTYNFTLLELLELFLPVIPANNLQGVLDYGNTATQDINLFGTITTTNLNVTDTANLYITYLNEETHIVGSVFDSLDLVGTPGQVLTSTGEGVEWYTLPPIFTPTLQQVLTEGNTADIDILLDANLEALNVSADTANIATQLSIQGVVMDYNESVGSSGQVLASTSINVEWVSLPVYSATSPLLFDAGTGVFSIQVANATQGGYLSANDWITFDGKQNAGSYITALTGEATASGPGSVPITLNNASVIAKVLTGLNITGGSISATDSILAAFGKVQNQINGLMGGVQYQGVWNADTNTPTLTSSVGSQGWYYIVNVAGNTNLNGITDWQVGDWAIFSGGAWQKVDNTDSVTSVNGQTGAVSLTTDNIPEGTTNLYFLNSRARAALSFQAGSGAYNNTTGVITIPTDNSQILNGAGYITLGSLSASSPLSYNNLTGAFSIQQASGSQNGYLSSTDWTTFNNKQNYLNGNGLVKSTAGTITYITDNSTNWNTAYDRSIVGAAVTGTTTKTLTLTEQDGNTITASWTDLDTGLTSVGVTMPSAFSVANSPLTSNGTIAITGAGTSLEYIDGTGALRTFPGLTGYVPYVGATTNVDLGEYGISAGYFQADLTPSGALQVGRMQWNAIDGTMDLRLMGNNVTLQIGEENVTRVVNKSGVDLLEANYQVVRIRKVAEGGAQGQRLAVVLAQGNSENNSTEVLGLVTETINVNQEGFVTNFGEVKEINTTGSLQGETWVDGNILYLSNIVAGGLTNVRPVAPNHSVIVGYVTYAHAVHGKIYVAVDTGYELGELHNVYAPSPANNASIWWNSSTLRYENNTIAGILGYTPANAATTIATTAPLQGGGDLSANRTFSITQAGTASDGYLSSTDWNTFNNKQPAGSYVPTSRLLSINGTQYDLSADRSWSVGTVTSVAALTLGTTGTDLSSSVANGTTTPVITLNVPTASAANRGALSAADWSTFNTKVGSVTASSPLASSGGSTPNITIQQASGSQNGYLSSTDWTTFNNKQAAGNYITSLTGEATATGPGAASVTLSNSAVTGKVLTGINITGGTVVDTDSILTGFGKLQNQINSLVGGTIYKGTWNAATNTPALASGVGTKGWYYIVNVAGTTNLDGITDWFVGDWAIFDGTAWQQVDNTDAVVSVNGQTGAVSLTTDNIPEGSTNQYFLNSRARAALSFTAGSGAYNSTTGVITIPTNTSQLTNGANFITLASLSGVAPISYNNGTGAISITQAGTASNGYLSSTDWNTFNNKQATLTFSAPLVNTAGTVSIPAATSSVNGYLTSTDWTTFNNKQNALTNPVTGTGTANYVARWTSSSVISTGVLIDNGTNVGINETSPNNKLYVNAGSGTPGFNTGVTIKTSNGTYTSGDGGMLQFQNEDVITAGIRGVRASGWGSSLIFYVHNSIANNTYGTSFVPVLTLDETSNATFAGKAIATQFNSTSSSAAIPAFSVSSGNGMYNGGTNILNFSTNGTAALSISATQTATFFGPGSFQGYALSGDFGANYTVGFGVGMPGTSPNKGVNIGWNNVADFGFIGAVQNGTAWKTLVLQPVGGSVYVGATANSSLYAGYIGLGGTDPQERLAIYGGNIKFNTGQNVAGQYTYIGTEYSVGNGNNKAEIRFGIESDTYTKISFWTANGAGNIGQKLNISSGGIITVANLAGTGSRIVVADASGNLSAGSALSGYVPYTGATSNVNLGVYSLTANGLIAYNAAGSVYVDINASSSGTTAGIRYFSDGSTKWIQGISTPSTYRYSIGKATSATAFTEYLGIDYSTGGAQFSNNVVALGAFTGYAGLNGYAGATQNLLIDWSAESQVTTLTNTNLFFGTNAQRRMTILAGGFVGIGTATPAVKFEVVGAKSDIQTTDNGVVNIVDNSGYGVNSGGSLVFRGIYNSSGSTCATGFINTLKNNSTDGDYGYAMAFGSRAYGSSTIERMRLTSLGELLVGSTSNQHNAKLNVAGKLFLPYTSNSDIGGAFYSYNDTSYQLYAGGLKLQIFNNDGLSYGLRDAVTITGGGNLGVGTTSPAGRLTVAGPNGAGISIDQGNYNYYGAYSHIFKSSSYTTEYMRITNSGYVGIGISSPYTPLDVQATDSSGNRTSPIDVITITAENGNNPYNGFGGGLLFRNRQYAGGPSPGGILTSARIRSSINNNSFENAGGSLIFEVTPTGGGSLTTALTIAYNGTSTFSSSLVASTTLAVGDGSTYGTNFNVTSSNSSNGFTGGVIRNSAISGAIAGMAFMAYDWVQGGIWHGRGATSGKDGALVLGTNPDTSVLGVGGLTGRVFIFNNGNVSINNQADSGKKFYVNGNAYITSDLGVGNGISLYGQLTYTNTYSSSSPFEFLKITYGGGAYCGIKMTVYNPVNSIDSNLGFSVMNSSGAYTELLLLQGSAQQAYFRAAINTTSSLYVSSTATIAYSGLSGDFGSGYTTGMGVGYSSSVAKGINMGWNTTYDMGFIGTVHNGTAWKSLALCPIGGGVYIGITGNNYIYAGAFFEGSDMRLKQLIEDDYRAVGIESVKARLYTKEGKIEIGYYAQDLESILPSAVSKTDAGFLSLSYTQVHTAKIAVIEDKVTILEREVAELKSKLQKYEA